MGVSTPATMTNDDDDDAAGDVKGCSARVEDFQGNWRLLDTARLGVRRRRKARESKGLVAANGKRVPWHT